MERPPPYAVELVKAAPAGSRILVSTDNADDVRQIVKQLSHVFDGVRSSTVADDATADFEACRPQVLVLAFDTLRQGAAVLPRSGRVRREARDPPRARGPARQDRPALTTGALRSLRRA
jgi:hypothetical protein